MNFIPKNSKTLQLLSVFLMAGAFVVVAYAAQVNVDSGRTHKQRVMTDDGCTPTPTPTPTITPGPTIES